MSEKDAIRKALLEGKINQNSKIQVSVCRGPAGGYGFRKGMWPVQIGTEKFRVFSSVSHSSDLDEQEDTIVQQIQRFLNHALETVEHKGKQVYRYTSQSEQA